MTIFSTILRFAVAVVPLTAASKVQHSSIKIPLAKVENRYEKEHVQQVHFLKTLQSRKFSSQNFLRLQQVPLQSLAEIPLHDQVIASKKLATYFADIAIGENPSTKFKVLLDTGSCEFWVPDEECLSSQCMGHTKYHRSYSFEPRFTREGKPSVMDVVYLSGTLQGYDGYETVHIGEGIKVPRVNIGFATTVDIPLLKDLTWDGILGLGFRNHEITNRGVTTFLDRIVETGVLKSKQLGNQFGYYINSKGGSVTFGGADMTLKHYPNEEFSWVPVDPRNSYWTVKVLGVRKEPRMDSVPKSVIQNFNEMKFQMHDGGKDSIVDTGTYLIYAPSSTMVDYLGDIRVASCEDKKYLPDLVFSFLGKERDGKKTFVDLRLTPDDYVLEFTNDDGTFECMLGIAADDAESEDELGGWTFGQVFLRSYYSVFDRDNLEIGFARARH